MGELTKSESEDGEIEHASYSAGKWNFECSSKKNVLLHLVNVRKHI